MLLWLAAPAAGLGWLAWVALVPAAAAALVLPDGRAARLALPVAYSVYLELSLVPALPFGLAEGQWNDPPLPVLVGGSPVLVVALVAVPLLGLVLYAIGFGLPRGGPIGAVLVPAASWTALDFVRAKLDPGGAFGPLYLSQYDQPAADLAALAGPWLITLAIAATGYALALLLVRIRVPAARLATGAALAAVAVAAVATAGSPGGLTVAAVQPGYDTAEEDRPELRYFERGSYDVAALDTIADLGVLTREAAARGARLVVWPEAAIWLDPNPTPATRAALVGLARDADVAIVVPYFARRRAQGAAVIVTPDGRVTRPQPKQRPMWFLGEHGGNRLAPDPVQVGGVRVGSLLGVDSQDPGVARRLAAREADVLVSSTHDWERYAIQQRALARLHASGTRVPVVRADWRYGSAIYDAGGEVLAEAGDGKRRQVLVATVSPAGGPTPYTRIGDTLGWLALVGAALGAVARPLRRSGAASRRSPGAEGAPAAAAAAPPRG